MFAFRFAIISSCVALIAYTQDPCLDVGCGLCGVAGTEHAACKRCFTADSPTVFTCEATCDGASVVVDAQAVKEECDSKIPCSGQNCAACSASSSYCARCLKDNVESCSLQIVGGSVCGDDFTPITEPCCDTLDTCSVCSDRLDCRVCVNENHRFDCSISAAECSVTEAEGQNCELVDLCASNDCETCDTGCSLCAKTTGENYPPLCRTECSDDELGIESTSGRPQFCESLAACFAIKEETPCIAAAPTCQWLDGACRINTVSSSTTTLPPRVSSTSSDSIFPIFSNLFIVLSSMFL